jgi:hypothetical protein
LAVALLMERGESSWPPLVLRRRSWHDCMLYGAQSRWPFALLVPFSLSLSPSNSTLAHRASPLPQALLRLRRLQYRMKNGALSRWPSFVLVPFSLTLALLNSTLAPHPYPFLRPHRLQYRTSGGAQSRWPSFGASAVLSHTCTPRLHPCSSSLPLSAPAQVAVPYVGRSTVEMAITASLVAVLVPFSLSLIDEVRSLGPLDEQAYCAVVECRPSMRP